MGINYSKMPIQLQMTKDFLVYTFTLKYEPQEIHSAPIVRMNSATVRIECTYSR